MTRSGITLFSAVVVPLAVIAATVALVFVWCAGGKSVLFRINLGYGLLLELIFFGYIGMVRRGLRSFTGAFYSIMGVCSVYYMVGGVVLICISGLIPLKFHVTAIAMLTSFWLVIGALIAETDSHHREDVETTKEKNKKLMNRE